MRQPQELPPYLEPVTIWEPQPGSQVAFLTCPYDEILYEGTRGPGKRLQNDTPVLTDSGWKRAGDVALTDKLVARDGTYTQLLGIYPHPPQELYKVTFDEGQEILCGPEHLWSTLCPTNGPRDGWLVRDTEWLYNKIKKRAQRTTKGYIQTPRLSAPVPGKHWTGYDPYLIGLMLGDGTYNNEKRALLYTADQETLDYVTARGWSTKLYSDKAVWYAWPTSTDRAALRKVLKAAKRCGKVIPQELLEADSATRLAVVQGLLDSDGCCDTEGRVTFTNTSLHLMKGLQYLVRSLGGKMTYAWYERALDIRENFTSLGRFRGYITMPNGMQPFRLTRKAERVKQTRQNVHRGIVSVEPAGTGAAVCFAVAHPSHQFVIDGFVVTHNTDALLMKYAQHVGEGYGEAWRGIIFRKTYKQLSDVTAKSLKWFRQIFPFAKFNKSDHSWEWPTGEQLLFRYMDNPIDYWNYHGHEYPFIGWEELTNWADPGCYDSMKSCNRSSHPDPTMPRFYGGTCNPFGIGHHWVKARFIDMGPAKKPVIEQFKHPLTGEMILMRRCYIHGDWRENRKLVDNDPLYIAKLMAITDENKRKAWLEGDWNITAGSILGAWYNSAVHEIEPFKIPSTWKIDRSFDYGSSKPFSVGWWAESDGTQVYVGNQLNPASGRVGPVFKSWPKGTLFRINEWYGCKENEPNVGLEMLTSDIAKGIVEREKAMVEGGLIAKKPVPGPADSSIFDMIDGRSIASEFKKHGVTWLTANKSPGSRVAGWSLLRDLLANALDRDEHGGPTTRTTPMEEPGFFIFNTCRSWIRTVPMMPRDQDKPDDVDTKSEDHAGDETRYRIYKKAAESNTSELNI